MVEFDKVKRFVEEATRFEDALRGMTVGPFSEEFSQADLLDFLWKVKQLAYFYKLNEWNCSDVAVEIAANKRAKEIVEEVINDQHLIRPEEIPVDEGFYKRGRG